MVYADYIWPGNFVLGGIGIYLYGIFGWRGFTTAAVSFMGQELKRDAKNIDIFGLV